MYRTYLTFDQRLKSFGSSSLDQRSNLGDLLKRSKYLTECVMLMVKLIFSCIEVIAEDSRKRCLNRMLHLTREDIVLATELGHSATRKLYKL